MTQDSAVVIGAIDNYPLNTIKPWVLSLKESGYSGAAILITYRVTPDVVEWIERQGIATYQISYTPSLGDIFAHNLRFYHIWELMTRMEERATWAVFTDVSDVIFQKNPILYIEKRLLPNEDRCEVSIASSEGITYENEEWGMNNMQLGYGMHLWELQMKTKTIYNVGTIAGQFNFMKNLALTIYEMTVGRHYPSDQSSYNVLIHGILHPYTKFTNHGISSWAANLGTTNDPTKSHLWSRCHEPRPIITADKKVITINNEEYHLVHQWNRVPELNKHIKEKYGI
jgi:hypothetical protein